MNGAYTCLSYVWGGTLGSLNPNTILVDGKPMHLLRNLYDFLQIACQQYHGELFWIDALCINQQNIEERNHQVAQMGDIYTGAKQVIAWLGACESVANPLKYLRCQVSELKDLQKNWKRVRETYALDRQKHHDFFESAKGYWSRAWITQELAVARRVLLVFGTVELDLHACNDEALVLALMDEFSSVHNMISIYKTPILRIWRLATDWRWKNGSRIETTTTTTFHDERSLDRSLLSLLFQFRTKECLRGRDHIYSLRYLCSEGQSLQINYSMPSLQLLRHILRISERPLCFCSVRAVTLALLSSPEDQHEWAQIYLQLEMTPTRTIAAYWSTPNEPVIGEPVPKEFFFEKCKECDTQLPTGVRKDDILCCSQICTGSPVRHFRINAEDGLIEYISSWRHSVLPPDDEPGVTHASFVLSASGNAYLVRFSASHLLHIISGDSNMEEDFGCDV